MIPDASFLWWTLRPSTRYPTLELRVADSCTRLDDALAVAALYRCLVRMLVRRPEVNRGLTGADRGIAAENLWRVQRYGIQASLVGGAGAVSFADRLDAVLAEVAEDADALGCAAALPGARRIMAEGTSADAQVAGPCRRGWRPRRRGCGRSGLAGGRDGAGMKACKGIFRSFDPRLSISMYQATAPAIGAACAMTPGEVRTRLSAMESRRLVASRSDKAAAGLSRRAFYVTGEGKRAAGINDARTGLTIDRPAAER